MTFLVVFMFYFCFLIAPSFLSEPAGWMLHYRSNLLYIFVANKIIYIQNNLLPLMKIRPIFWVVVAFQLLNQNSLPPLCSEQFHELIWIHFKRNCLQFVASMINSIHGIWVLVELSHNFEITLVILTTGFILNGIR